MPVLRRYRLAAQFTVLLGGLRRLLCRLLGLLLGEPAQGGESGESLPIALLDHIPQPTALGRAIFTMLRCPRPCLSSTATSLTSSGMGSRCSCESSRHLPARRTS